MVPDALGDTVRRPACSQFLRLSPSSRFSSWLTPVADTCAKVGYSRLLQAGVNYLLESII